jgi:hypothetical protein
MNADESTAHLIARLEERLLQPEIRRSRTELQRLLAAEFVEFGSDGKAHDRDSIIEELALESEVDISITNFQATALAPNVVLAKYRAVARKSTDAPGRHSLRCSIWKLRDGEWQMVFHQGTPVTGK